MTEDHFSHLEKLLRIEEEEERKLFEEEFLKKSPEEREKSGLALLHLVLVESHYSPGGHFLFTFSYPGGRPIPVYSFDIGDVVEIEKEAAEPVKVYGGTVYDKTKDVITVAFDRVKPEAFTPDGVYHLSRSSSRGPYRRMYDALDMVRRARHSRVSYLRDVTLGLKEATAGDPIPIEKIVFFNPKLNHWQKEAVRRALEAQDVALVHGPPGTGKTTVLIEIIRQNVSADRLVMATAPSNTACDHLLECLVGAGINALRLGHPARILEHLRDHTLDFKLAKHPDVKKVEALEFELDRCFVQRGRKRERGMMNREGEQDLKERITDLKGEIRSLEDSIFDRVIHEAEVIVGTLSSAGDAIFGGRELDLLIFDEATQAMEPASWIPLLRAKKAILAGDHFQLPPTIRSRKAEEGGLGVTLFERLYDKLTPEFRSLLRVQYRMNEKIMNFSSGKFYDWQLIADNSVKNHTLSDLSHVTRAPETEEVFLFLDTAGRGFEEMLEPASESRYNPEEASLVGQLLKRLLHLGVKPEEVAVISPYSAQVRLMASQFALPGLEIDSVDGFQGREKEVVVLSLVRSNVEGEMGFLTDTRRMNVAMTRARRKLVVIGDSATLSSIPFYRDFIQYAESIGAYKSSWEMMA